MNYFTSIKNTFYFSWQIELLIESFKQQGLNNQLYISLDDELVVASSKNLKNHNHILVGNDYSEYGNPALNKICSLLEAIENESIKFPICLIHPDMILRKAISDELEGDVICSVTIDEDEEELKQVKDQYDNIENKNDFPELFPVGNVVVFNTNQIEFIRRLVEHSLSLCQTENFEKIALARTCYDFYGISNIKFELMESTLLHNEFDSNFIHYKNGIPPQFMKHKFDEEFPYQMLTEFNSTTNLKYVSQLTQKYLIG